MNFADDVNFAFTVEDVGDELELDEELKRTESL
jgi:hypothetical protein